jgi:cobalt transporter subunit CbtA
MTRFRGLIALAIVSGVLAGLLLFAAQRVVVFPLIQQAEVYESAAEARAEAGTAAKLSGMSHSDEGWQPAEGLERTSFTALTTVLGAIGFAAVLFGVIALKSQLLDWRSGALWGLAAYICVDLAPALGLPPQPPGTAVADINARQLWWIATILCTAAGLWLLIRWRQTWTLRALGVAVVLLPHAIGAPSAAGRNEVPAELIHRFIAASLSTTCLFWLALGIIGGLLHRRFVEHSPSERV